MNRSQEGAIGVQQQQQQQHQVFFYEAQISKNAISGKISYSITLKCNVSNLVFQLLNKK